MDDDDIADRVRRNAAQPVLAAIFQDESNCAGEALFALLDRSSLAIRAGDLGAEADVPVVVALDDRREFASHVASDGRLQRPDEFARDTWHPYSRRGLRRSARRSRAARSDD